MFLHGIPLTFLRSAPPSLSSLEAVPSATFTLRVRSFLPNLVASYFFPPGPPQC